jgi:hypothetical protein
MLIEKLPALHKGEFMFCWHPTPIKQKPALYSVVAFIVLSGFLEAGPLGKPRALLRYFTNMFIIRFNSNTGHCWA